MTGKKTREKYTYSASEQAADKAASSNDYSSQMEEYWNSSGLPDSYRKEYESIWKTYDPSLIQNTFWDDVSNFFGARSKSDVLRMQQTQARNEALQQLIAGNREEEYNAPLASAARKRQAGQNPDLTGTDDAGEATEFNEPETSLDYSGLSTGADLAQSFTQAFTTALSLTQGLQSVYGMQIDNSLKKMSSFKNYRDMAEDLFTSRLDAMDIIDPYSSGDLNMFQIPDETFNKYGIKSKRMRNRLRQHFSDLQTSFYGKMKQFDYISDYYSNRDKSIMSRSQWYHGNDPFDDDGVRSALRAWADFQHKVENYELNAQSENSQYAASYYRGLDPSKAYESQNSAEDYKKFLMQCKRELYNKLTGSHASTFELMLALQLMGDVDIAGNSGLSSLVKGAAKLF